MDRLLRQSDIIKLLIETAPIPMSEEQKEAFESGLVDMLKDIPAVEPTVDKDYLMELIQGAVYDGEDCARLMKMVEPKQGEWITTKSGHYKCSICGCYAPFWYNEDNSCEYHYEIGAWLSNYCPDCGARMKGADDEHDK